VIKLEKTDVYGWEAAIRGMRNPLNSWDKSDSEFSIENSVKEGRFKQSAEVGSVDMALMMKLSKAGDDHGKFLRMINVTVDITAPLYWWKEFDTYKVGTVANSCSTMHKLTEKEFELDDFSHDHLTPGTIDNVLKPLISILNASREAYLKFEEFNKEDPEGWDEGITCKKDIWWQMIQTLPSSYNQKRTVQLNYQVLKAMYHARKTHKLDEWREFCAWCEELPYFIDICIVE
jgi:hypothetical protein